jgi:hypothetical protein
MKISSLESTAGMTTTLLVAMLAFSQAALAQLAAPTSPAKPPGPPPAAQQAAPFDLTGYWVSIVTEDWRWRMMTPPHGDYTSVPLNPEGKKLADTWTADQDGSCKAYYAAGLMRMPTRLHITWASPDVLKIETDWGQQTRMLYFKRQEAPVSGPTPQGSSLASWERLPVYDSGAGRTGKPPPNPGGYLKVATSALAPGWLRRNGVPYGANTSLTEYIQTYKDPTGKEWFDVTTQVDDPEYLAAPFITSSEFRREPDSSKWSPHPCKS